MSIDAKIARVAAISVLLFVLAGGAAEAQGLGKLGRAVKDGIGNSAGGAGDASPGSSAPSASGRGAGFTAAQLDAFAAGLAVETEQRSKLAAQLAALEPRPNYEQCKLDFVMSPAGEAAMEAYTAALEVYAANPGSARSQEVLQAAGRKFEEAVTRSCGPSPDEAPRLRQEKQSEPARMGAEAAGVNAAGYARLKELVLPFCAAEDRFEAGSAAAIPSGAGKSYSYSADDTALLKPRCARLLPLIQATL